MLHVILETTKNVNLWLNPIGKIEQRSIALKAIIVTILINIISIQKKIFL
jgi:hypothetical protein